jgi:hypothetical protein
MEVLTRDKFTKIDIYLMQCYYKNSDAVSYFATGSLKVLKLLKNESSVGIWKIKKLKN